jgi:tRNA nucleotidyltransferase (CCA-adding enzyme)
MRVYQVGGAVRDRLLGLSPQETDWVVTGASVEDMLAQGFRPKDPTIPVFLHPQSGDEYALARREKKRSQGHKGFDFEHGPDVSLEEDLGRRDLTVNAMAEDAHGTIIDPYGGRGDLAARRLRHVSPAFSEDPLRVLRLARFAAQLSDFRFTVDGATASLAEMMSADDDLLSLTTARCWRELSKSLAAPEPGQYLVQLSNFGALPRLMPWLDWPVNDDAAGPSPAEAMNIAAGQSADPGARLAAACLAARRSGATGAPPDDWPLPRDIRQLIQVCQRNPLPESIEPRIVLAWLEAMDAWRRKERMQLAVSAWRAARPDRDDRLTHLAAAAEAASGSRPPANSEDPRQAVRQARGLRAR